MERNYDINKLDEKIKTLRKIAEEIKEAGGEIEAVKRNINRVLASTKMLEINVCDVKAFL
jgi:hypothetical protein